MHRLSFMMNEQGDSRSWIVLGWRGRTEERTDEDVPRGSRTPKKCSSSSILLQYLLQSGCISPTICLLENHAQLGWGLRGGHCWKGNQFLMIRGDRVSRRSSGVTEERRGRLWGFSLSLKSESGSSFVFIAVCGYLCQCLKRACAESASK